jgi:hypothetical protein
MQRRRREGFEARPEPEQPAKRKRGKGRTTKNTLKRVEDELNKSVFGGDE